VPDRADKATGESRATQAPAALRTNDGHRDPTDSVAPSQLADNLQEVAQGVKKCQNKDEVVDVVEAADSA
jgi:hypothetical protein